MGYNGGRTHILNLGGTDWVFSEDSLRLVRVEREAEFYVTDFSLADEDGALEIYSNGCHLYDAQHNIIENGDSINYGRIWEEQCPTGGYSHAQGGLLF